MFCLGPWGQPHPSWGHTGGLFRLHRWVGAGTGPGAPGEGLYADRSCASVTDAGSQGFKVGTGGDGGPREALPMGRGWPWALPPCIPLPGKGGQQGPSLGPTYQLLSFLKHCCWAKRGHLQRI